MILRELLFPTPPDESLDGLVVEAVSALPDDPAPEWEGDDSAHGGGDAKAVEFMRAQHGAQQPSASGPRVVPFVRIVQPRMHGQDVIAFQRALQAAGFRRIRPTGWHGPISVANLKAFERAHHLNEAAAYGKLAHHALLPYFDSYGAWLMMQARKAEAIHAIRQSIVATALFGVSVRDRIDYSQGAHRLDAVAEHLKPPHFPVRTDCSGFATWCYQVAGGPDPSGHRFDVRAREFTGSMAQAGRRVATPELGDLGLYGHGAPFKHVVVYIGGGRAVSHGSAPGPLVVPVHYRPDFAEFRSYL